LLAVSRQLTPRGHVILVDDGLATGATMRAAAAALRQQGPARIVVAVPVGAEDACDAFRTEVDKVVCSRTPEPFHGVGLWYADFSRSASLRVLWPAGLLGPRQMSMEIAWIRVDGARKLPLWTARRGEERR
jgi:hypothetical protein